MAAADAPLVDAETAARTLARFEEHRRAWETNPALRTLYAEWYARVAAALAPASFGPRVELGSGPGFARAFVPDLELTDLVKAPWHDRQVSAEALPYADASLGGLVLFDVLHHIPSPRRFFTEATRVLKASGRCRTPCTSFSMTSRCGCSSTRSRPARRKDEIPLTPTRRSRRCFLGARGDAPRSRMLFQCSAFAGSRASPGRATRHREDSLPGRCFRSASGARCAGWKVVFLLVCSGSSASACW